MPNRLVTVRRCSTPYEARLALARLRNFDIEATLADDCTINVNWLWSNALGGVKVQVPDSQAADAVEVLSPESIDESTEETATDEAIPCPECGSLENYPFLDKRWFFLSWLLLGIPVFPGVSKRLCAHCGARWVAGHGAGY